MIWFSNEVLPKIKVGGNQILNNFHSWKFSSFYMKFWVLDGQNRAKFRWIIFSLLSLLPCPSLQKSPRAGQLFSLPLLFLHQKQTSTCLLPSQTKRPCELTASQALVWATPRLPPALPTFLPLLPCSRVRGGAAPPRLPWLGHAARRRPPAACLQPRRPPNGFAPTRWYSQARARLESAAGTSPSPLTAAAGRLLPSPALLRPLRHQPRPPRGSSRVPHAPPPLPGRRDGLLSLVPSSPSLSIPKIATRGSTQELEQVQGVFCEVYDSYE